jgi:hypothetical protein
MSIMWWWYLSGAILVLFVLLPVGCVYVFQEQADLRVVVYCSVVLQWI